METKEDISPFLVCLFFLLVSFFSSNNRSKTVYINGKSHNIPIQYHLLGEMGGAGWIKQFRAAAAALFMHIS